MLLQQNAAGFNHVLRFAVKQTDCLDVGLNPFNAKLQHRGWRIGDGVELSRRFIDADIGGLRGEQD